MFGFNYFQLGAMALGVLIPIFLLIHFWPKLKPVLARLFGARVSKELDREHVDLEEFLKQFDALRAQATVLVGKAAAAPAAAPNVVPAASVPAGDIDAQIASLQAQKRAQDVAAAEQAVRQAQATLIALRGS